MILELLREPDRAAVLTPAQWDAVVRLGRMSRLLGTLRARLAAADVLRRVPDAPARHLEAARIYADFRAAAMRRELREIDRALGDCAVGVVLLKGAAYVLGGHPAAIGRLPGDVDVLVPKERLAEVEQRLLARGWVSDVDDAYDQQYYRAWSHEIPPLRFPGRDIEVDVHHTITPIVGRFRPDPALLLAAARPLPGSRWHVLCPEDQLLHAAVHLFQDSDLPGHIRDLVDIHALAQRDEQVPGYWERVGERAAALGLGQPLGLALRAIRRMLAPGFGPDSLCALRHSPGNLAMDWVVANTLLPAHPDAPPSVSRRLAALGALMRYHRFRMPPLMLARHLVVKATRRLRPNPSTER